jgi:hypothetical protein
MYQIMRPDGKLSKPYSRVKIIKSFRKGNIPQGCSVVTDGGNVPVAEFCRGIAEPKPTQPAVTPETPPSSEFDFVDRPASESSEPAPSRLQRTVTWLAQSSWALTATLGAILFLALGLGNAIYTHSWRPLIAAIKLFFMFMIPVAAFAAVVGIASLQKHLSKSDTLSLAAPTLLVFTGSLAFFWTGSWKNELWVHLLIAAVFLGTLTNMVLRQWKYQAIPVVLVLIYAFWFVPFKARDHDNNAPIFFHCGLMSSPYKLRSRLEGSLTNYEAELDPDGRWHGKVTYNLWVDSRYHSEEHWYYHGEECTRLEFDTASK